MLCFSISQSQATKFGNYFLSSKYTTVVDNLSFLLAATSALATNQVRKADMYSTYTNLVVPPPILFSSSSFSSSSFSLSLSLSLLSLLCLVPYDSQTTSQSLRPIRTWPLSSLQSWVEVLGHSTSEWIVSLTQKALS